VKFDAAGAPGGKYPFRLDVASALNPDEDFTEGPTVSVEIAAATVPPPPKKKFPLWIIFVIAGVVLIIIIVVIILVVRSGSKEDNNNGEATPTPVESSPAPTASATATPAEEREFRVTKVTLDARPDDYVGPCPVTVTFTGTVTVNKAGKVKYTFIRSDGARDTNDLSLDFDGPGTKTVETTWHLGAAVPTFQPFKGFQQLRSLSPNQMDSDRASFVLRCK